MNDHLKRIVDLRSKQCKTLWESLPSQIIDEDTI